MDEYIKREDAFETITDIAGKAPTRSAYEAVWKSARALKKVPAADVAPVVHGRWIEKTVPERCRYFECSNCGAHENKHTAIKGYYCWRCGAKMDGGADND